MDSNEIIKDEISEAKENDERKILASNIAFFRKKVGISQTELAKRLKYSNKNVSKWECGETTPDVFTVKKLAEIFGIPVDALLSPISNDTKEAIKTKQTVSYKWKVYMLLLSNAIFFLLTCIAFFALKASNVTSFNIAYLYVYMLPAMALSAFIFICCVKKKVDWISLSLFGWLLTVCFFISFIHSTNIAYIFIIALGWQVIVPIFAKLVNSGKIIRFNKLILSFFKKEGK